MDKVSFIIPVHNAEKTIEKTVQSIINLKLNHEILIVENGSTDSTMQIISSLENKFDGVVCLKSEKGVSKARNKGIAEATGKWIIFVDADDECTPELVTCLKRVLVIQHDNNEADNIDIVIASYLKDKNSIIHDYRILNKVLNVSNELKAWLISKPTLRMQAWAKIYNADFLRNNVLEFDENLRYSEDSEFVIRVLLKAKKAVITDVPIYKYNSGTVSAMRSFVNGRIKEYIKALEVAEADVKDENEKVKKAFVDYVIAHINIIGVHDIFGVEIKESWKNRCEKMSSLLDELVIKRAVKYMKPSLSLQTIPVLFCKYRLTILGGVVYYIRSVQNRRRYKRFSVSN